MLGMHLHIVLPFCVTASDCIVHHVTLMRARFPDPSIVRTGMTRAATHVAAGEGVLTPIAFLTVYACGQSTTGVMSQGGVSRHGQHTVLLCCGCVS